jgi:hypothetical protein
MKILVLTGSSGEVPGHRDLTQMIQATRTARSRRAPSNGSMSDSRAFLEVPGARPTGDLRSWAPHGRRRLKVRPPHQGVPGVEDRGGRPLHGPGGRSSPPPCWSTSRSRR